MLKTLTKLPNVLSVTYSLIKKLDIPVSLFTIEKDLPDHPDYPSLLAIRDCLTSWQIPNEAFKVDKETFAIEELPLPFIAHLKIEGGRFILVDKVENEIVVFSDEEDSRGTINKTDFISKWDGIVLYAEKEEKSGESNYRNTLIRGWLNKGRLPFFLVVLFIGIVSAVNYSNSDWGYLSLLVLNLSGVSVSALLLTHSINANNPFVQNLCSLGKKNNCNAILKSDAAKVTSWLSWSEVGMFYFAGSFICLLFNPSSVLVLSWLNLLCLPYTFYSIGYQLKIKNWCLLCCCVQGLLWLEFGVFLLSGYSFQPPEISPSLLFLSLLSYLLPIATWALIKPVLLKAEQMQPLKQQLKKFKYNSRLFNQLLSSQTHYVIADELMPIVLGNPEADTVITMVSNPFCGPCATAHKTLNNWINERDDIQLKILFTTANHDDDNRTKVARHVTALSLLEDRGLAEAALNAWYEHPSKKYELWAKDYPVHFNGEMNGVTERQKEWCEEAEISFTPTILVNGYKLIDPYGLDDIKYLLE